MQRAYDFESQLASLRLLLSKESQLLYPYQRPNYAQIMPLQIVMDSILRRLGYSYSKRRDAVRKAILGYIAGLPHLGSTYDLSIYQAACICGFLQNPDSRQLYSYAEKFIQDCADRVEGKPVPRQGSFIDQPLGDTYPGSQMPDL